MTPHYTDPLVTLYLGDCLEVMHELPDASVDSVVTDPPYGLEFMGKEWDRLLSKRDAVSAARPEFRGQTASPYISARVEKYVAGTAMQAWHEQWATEAFRVLKPGGYLLAFGGTRTYHRLASAIEDAGFEIRDTLMWIYASGFPKSLDVSKALDKKDGRMGWKGPNSGKWQGGHLGGGMSMYAKDGEQTEKVQHEPESDLARKWEGWGTALKPAHEPVILGAKPVTVEQHFAIILEYLTAFMEDEWSGSLANDAVESLTATRVRFGEVASSVLEPARTRSLASIGLALSAAPGSTSAALASPDPTRTPDATALSHVRPSSSADRSSDPTTQPGEAAGMLTRLAAMSTSVATGDISPNTVSSWRSLSDDLLAVASTSTIETVSRLTTALRILNLSMSLNTSGDTGRKYRGANTRPIVMARKPLVGTVAANVTRYGVGAINIEATRIGYTSEADKPTQEEWNRAGSSGKAGANGFAGQFSKGMKDAYAEGKIPVPSGRWPSNVLLSDPELFDESNPGVVGSGATRPAGGGITEGEHADIGYHGNGTWRDEWAGYGDAGGYSRFFIIPKADRAERERGLASLALRLHRERGECDKLSAWERPAPSPSDRTATSSLARDTSGEPSQEPEGSSSATSPRGKTPTDPSPRATRSTTSTGTSRTTSSATSSSLTPPPISESTPGASLSMGFGGSPAESADSSDPSGTSGGTSPEKAGPSTAGADPATSERWSSRNACADCGKPLPRGSSHPTVKPIDLMRHLVRLVTPPGGVTLDPFLGSGTTALAASEEGFRCIGIEREAEYLEIAVGRLMATPMGLGLDTEIASTRAPARGHWPKDRPAGKDGWGFSGQLDLEERTA